MGQIAYSSIPGWARPGAVSDDAVLPGGTSYVLVGVGSAGGQAVAAWSDRMTGVSQSVTSVVAESVSEADERLRELLAQARVGVRLMLAGPVGACLALRATAVMAGLDDDEIGVMPCGSGPIDVHCAHCGEVTSVSASVDDVIPCATCDRELLVYHHVSRRTGRYLGYMLDAETLGAVEPVGAVR